MNSLILKISVYFWKIIMLLPRRAHLMLGQLIGNILLKIPFKRNKYSEANINLCFADLNLQDRRDIYKLSLIHI